MNFLDMASKGAFLHLFASKARTILDRIIGRISYTSIHDELPEKEKESSPDQEEEVLIAKSQSFQFQDLAINLEPSISQNLNPPKEKKFNLWKSLLKLRMIFLMLILGKA
jgi:hypothetical protein